MTKLQRFSALWMNFAINLHPNVIKTFFWRIRNTITATVRGGCAIAR